jgi:hypothetical protein
VYLAHSGGEPANEGDFAVYVNGTLLTQSPDIVGGDGDWPWTIGETLAYSGLADPEEVYVVYAGGSTDVLVKSKRLVGVTADVSSDTASTPQEIPCIYNITNDLLNDSIYLSQDISGTSAAWLLSGHMNFTIQDSASYVVLEGAPPIDFIQNDKVMIKFESGSSHIRLFAIGNIGWHIFADGVDVYCNDAWLDSSTQHFTSVILGAKITGHEPAESVINLQTSGPQPKYTLLYVNNTPLVNGLFNPDGINVTGIYPTKPTIFLMDTFSQSDKAPSYFIGKAENITVTP